MGIKPEASNIPMILFGRIITSNIALIKGIETRGAHIKAPIKRVLSNLGKRILLFIKKDRQIIKTHAA